MRTMVYELTPQSSKIYIPSLHPIIDDERARRRAGGQIVISDTATLVVDVLNASLPQIKQFVHSMIPPPAAAHDTAASSEGMALVNGHRSADAIVTNGHTGTSEGDVVMAEGN
jgi:hypothetical protein